MNKKTLISFALVFTILLSLLLASCSSKQNGSSFSPPSNGAGRNVTPDSSEITQSGEKLPPNGKTVIIDPGHGFRDPGAGAENYELGEGKDERWVTLAVSKLLGERLEDLGYSVVFTHQDESYPEIEQYLTDNYFDPNERVALVNSKTCDYFISLHCNIFDDPDADGTKLYIFDNPIKTNHDSEQIALLIADKIDTAFPDARKCTIDTQSLAVIREVTVASCLIEMGFISSPSDAEKLVDPDWQATFASAVADGINAYFFPTDTDDTAETEQEP